jgi:hypothetical protein
MCWGFECGDGWYSIIEEAAAKLELLIVEWSKATLENEYHPRASQIKEKFGTLRFYLSSGTDEMYEVVEIAERKSAFVCEECGKKGKLRGKGWLYTRCAKCWKGVQ